MNAAPFWFQSFGDNSIKVYDERTNMETGHGTVDGTKATLERFDETLDVVFKDDKLNWSDGDVWGTTKLFAAARTPTVIVLFKFGSANTVWANLPQI